MTDTEEMINRVHRVLKAVEGLSHAEAIRVFEAACVMVADDGKLEVNYIVTEKEVPQ